MRIPQPLPLPPRYDLDGNPVPHAGAGAGSFAQLESLVLQWRDERPDTLRCHPAVAHALVNTLPVAEYPPREYNSLIGIRLVVDAEMPYGTWKLLSGGSIEVDAGTIT